MDADTVWLGLPLAVMASHRAAVAVAWARMARRSLSPATCRPPVTWLRPLKAGVPALEEKLRCFVASMGAEDEAILGVEAGSAEEKLCAELASRDARVKAIVCDPAAAANPKVAKLLAMSPHARHERWIVADAEARIDAAFARTFRDEWETSGADVLTAGYRFVGMRSCAQWLDALAAIQTLWLGIELVRAFGRVRFTLGACTGVRRADVERIGGWAALGSELAEDQQLGARLAAAEKTVAISDAVLELEAEPMTWRQYWRHQRRVAVTYRVAAPAGALGMILTRGFTLCLVLAAALPGLLSATDAALAAGLHVAFVALQARRLGYRLGSWIWLSLMADLAESACWVSSWVSTRVWWGGKWWFITSRGQFRNATRNPRR